MNDVIWWFGVVSMVACTLFGFVVLYCLAFVWLYRTRLGRAVIRFSRSMEKGVRPCDTKILTAEVSNLAAAMVDRRDS